MDHWVVRETLCVSRTYKIEKVYFNVTLLWLL